MNEKIFGTYENDTADTRNYHANQLKALLQLNEKDSSDIPESESDCITAIVTLLQSGRYALSGSSAKRLAELASTDTPEDGASSGGTDDIESFLEAILACIALREISDDPYGIWECPAETADIIKMRAADLEAAALDGSLSSQEIEDRAEHIAEAVMAAHMLDVSKNESIYKGVPAGVLEALSSLRSHMLDMVRDDTFAGLEEMSKVVSQSVECAVYCHMLMTTDFVSCTDGAKARIENLVNSLEKAISSRNLETMQSAKADAEEFLHAAMAREALRSVSGSVGEDNRVIALKILEAYDAAIANGTRDEIRREAARIESSIEALVSLTAASSVSSFLEHADDGLMAAFHGWIEELRTSTLADDADTLTASTERFGKLLDSIVSYEALCRMIEVAGDKFAETLTADRAIARLRDAIIAGNAASADEREQEAYSIVNGSIHLSVLEQIMSQDDDNVIIGLYKAKLVKPYVELKVAVGIGNRRRIEEALHAVDGVMTDGRVPDRKAPLEVEAEEQVHGSQPESEEKSLTVLEAVAKLTSAKLEARRKLAEIEAKTTKIESLLGTDEGMAALAEAMLTGTAGQGTEDPIGAFTESLGLGKLSEW